MEKFFFKRIEVWAVLLLMVFGFIASILFGSVVRNEALGYERFGRLGKLAYALASVPADAQSILGHNNTMAVGEPDRFGDRQGWVLNGSDPGQMPKGYLLLSRYDGDVGHSVVELVDLQSLRVEHRVDIDADGLLAGTARDSKVVDFSLWNTERFRAIHPLLVPDGGLIIKDHGTPLFRLDTCGNMVWKIATDLFHHAAEIDSEGDIWVPTYIEPTQIDGLSTDYSDDGFARVSADGKILYNRSLTDVLMKHGYGNLLFSKYPFETDAIHLNDVEPVLSDGPFWQKGDVFLSLRHQSMVILFRPSTDKIIWMRQGPWAAQHDVDIVNDHTIALFNNNMYNLGADEFVEGANEVLFYNFATDKVSSPYRDIFRKHEIRTASEGLFTLTGGGHLLAEESNAGRFVVFAPDGRLVAEYINRANDGAIFHLGWSRYLERGQGDSFLFASAQKKCAG